MIPSQRPATPPIRVGLASDDPDLSGLAAWLGPEVAFEIAGGRPDVRLVGPAAVGAGGARVIRRHRLREGETPLVVIVADGSPAALVRDCYRAGAAEVLTLAEAPRDLAPALRRVVERTSSAQAHEQDTAALAAELERRARQLEATLAQLEQSYEQTLRALVSALDLREQETADHSTRVAFYAVRLGVRLGLSRPSLRDLYHGALLHDIGKIGIPDGVLLKPARLTDAEWLIMRTHPGLGSEILTQISFLCSARDVPLCHHEAWDGSGYPAGLAGAAIPLHARIFAVVDTYDALRSERPYKRALSHTEALPQVWEVAGNRLDPEIVRCFADESPGTWERLAAHASSQGTFSDALAAAEQP